MLDTNNKPEIELTKNQKCIRKRERLQLFLQLLLNQFG